jgi:hypothetical protein
MENVEHSAAFLEWSIVVLCFILVQDQIILARALRASDDALVKVYFVYH